VIRQPVIKEPVIRVCQRNIESKAGSTPIPEVVAASVGISGVVVVMLLPVWRMVDGAAVVDGGYGKKTGFRSEVHRAEVSGYGGGTVRL